MNKKINYKQLYLSLRLVIWLLPFFSYSYSDFSPVFKQLILFSKVGVTIWIVFTFLIIGRKNNFKFDKFDISIFLIAGTMIFSTLLNNGNFVRLYSYLLNILLPCLIVRIYLPKYTKILLKVTSFVFSVILIINLALMFIYPAGIFTSLSFTGYDVVRYNFLGLDNQIAPYILVGITFLLLHTYYQNRKMVLKAWIILLLILLNAIQLWSGTLLIGLSIFLITFIFLKYIKILRKLFTPKAIPFWGLALFIGVYYLQIQYLFSNLINGVLGKDLTFAGRIYIWSEALTMLRNSPIIGLGIQNNDSLIKYLVYGDYRNAHNMFLQMGLMTGLIGLVAFCANIFYSCRKLTAHKSHVFSLLLSSVLLGFCTMWLTEFYPNLFPLYLLLAVSNSIGLLINEGKNPITRNSIN
nr:O-antigen ligase family protein [Lysinibacillus timonensis]